MFNLEEFRKDITEIMQKHGVTWITGKAVDEGFYQPEWHGKIEIYYKDSKSHWNQQIEIDSFSI